MAVVDGAAPWARRVPNRVGDWMRPLCGALLCAGWMGGAHATDVMEPHWHYISESYADSASPGGSCALMAARWGSELVYRPMAPVYWGGNWQVGECVPVTSTTAYSAVFHIASCPPLYKLVGYEAGPNAGTCEYGSEVVESPSALAPPPPECEVCAGNPIYPLRGVKREVVDTRLSIGHLTLQFTYDTSSRIPKVPAVFEGARGLQQRGSVLGSPLWFSNLHRRLYVGTPSVSSGKSATVADRGTGVSRTSTRQGAGAPTQEPGDPDRLVEQPGGGYLYRDGRGGVLERYTAEGVLSSMAWLDGTRVDFGYSDADTPADVAPAPGLLITATDNTGRSLRLGYVVPGTDGATRLSTITDAAGRVTRLAYDAQGNLGGITWADGTARSFLYENGELPWALSGIRDERTVRYASFGYDSAGRAISTEHAGGVDRYSVSYTVPPSIQLTEQLTDGVLVRAYTWAQPQGVSLTQPDGQTTSWSTVAVNGKNQFASQGQEAGAGSLASSRSQAYDANGNLASRDDFNGTRSCFVNDGARPLVTVSVVGLGQGQACEAVTATNAALPAGARKTSTQRHPDWSLQTKQAAPGQITTNVYNGQPDPFAGNATASCAPSTATLPDGKPIAVLCKQVEQATTDADGHLGFSASLQAGPSTRVRTWTYNERGQVLTAKGTRSSDTTTYTYHAATDANHTVGDLATMTDASGKTTTYDKYNKLGQLLQSTDPDGVVTLRTYDARQRLLTSTVGSETTTYTYDPVGQLTQVTQPDGRWIGYEYDDAHRQTAVKDSRGNRIEYQLDNAGKQIGQTVKDPTGSLKRSLARVMDALGRVQQGSGRE